MERLNPGQFFFRLELLQTLELMHQWGYDTCNPMAFMNPRVPVGVSVLVDFVDGIEEE